MAIPVITECCYTCVSCLVGKQVCQLKRANIRNIYQDKCERYTQRKMEKCLLCDSYVINLAQHVTQEHKKSMMEYKIITQNKDNQQIKIRRKNIWE